jgi:hypothetical protein
MFRHKFQTSILEGLVERLLGTRGPQGKKQGDFPFLVLPSFKIAYSIIVDLHVVCVKKPKPFYYLVASKNAWWSY